VLVQSFFQALAPASAFQHLRNQASAFGLRNVLQTHYVKQVFSISAWLHTGHAPLIMQLSALYSVAAQHFLQLAHLHEVCPPFCCHCFAFSLAGGNIFNPYFSTVYAVLLPLLPPLPPKMHFLFFSFLKFFTLKKKYFSIEKLQKWW
jgi:hypothetical protein